MHNNKSLNKNFLILLTAIILSSLLNSGCGGNGGNTTPPINTNETAYRAFCVGVGDYIYYPDSHGNIDLPGPPYDVNRMRQTLRYCKFGLSNTGFSTISYLKDRQATKSNILQWIASTFSGADNNDISYFYFSGHGIWENNTS